MCGRSQVLVVGDLAIAIDAISVPVGGHLLSTCCEDPTVGTQMQIEECVREVCLCVE